MYKVKILLFLCGMEELTAGLNALRRWQLHKGGGNEWKGEGCVGKGRGENVWNGRGAWKGRGYVVKGRGTERKGSKTFLRVVVWDCLVGRRLCLLEACCCI